MPYCKSSGSTFKTHFQDYHRVLNRAVWSGHQAAKVLAGLLVRAFAPDGPTVLGIDETLKRRRGDKIAARGIYRDAVRSSKDFFVKASGLRWVSLMLLAPVPWAQRVWALPFLTVLAPSGRSHWERERRHKRVTDWARQMPLQVRRRLPERPLVVVADAVYAVLGLLHRCRRRHERIAVVARLRLPTLSQVRDGAQTVWAPLTMLRWYGQGERQIEVASGAVWYHSGMPPVPLRWVLVRGPEDTFETQALLCTDVAAEPGQIVSWFVCRRQVESTFQLVRTHLGVETHRQWGDKAILRTTPALLGLFSPVALMAPCTWTGRPACGLVQEGSAHLQRRPGSGAAAALARVLRGFMHVGRQKRHPGTHGAMA